MFNTRAKARIPKKLCKTFGYRVRFNVIYKINQSFMYTGCTLSNFDLIDYVVKMWNFTFSDIEIKTMKTLGITDGVMFCTAYK